MSTMSQVTKTFLANYATIYRPANPAKVLTIAKAVQAGDPVVAVNVGGIVRGIPTAARTVAPVAVKSVLSNVAYAAMALELVDLVENEIEKRNRRRQMALLVQQVSVQGLTDEISTQIQVLSRAEERRSFSQFVKDLPSRTFRRIARACLVEAGWWYGIITAPVWLPLVALDAAYSFAVVPALAVIMKAFNHPLDIPRAVMLPKPVLNFFLGFTLTPAARVFSKGAQMRLYNRTATRANITAYPILDAARDKAHDKIEKIVDGHTAFAWGEELAEQVSKSTHTTEAAQRAFAQSRYWVEDNIAPQFIAAVTAGVRTGTPLIYRDLVSVAS